MEFKKLQIPWKFEQNSCRNEKDIEVSKKYNTIHADFSIQHLIIKKLKDFWFYNLKTVSKEYIFKNWLKIDVNYEIGCTETDFEQKKKSICSPLVGYINAQIKEVYIETNECCKVYY